MQLASNPVTQALSEGRKQIGLWISLASPSGGEVTALRAMDWALIDTEHSPNGYYYALGQLQAFATVPGGAYDLSPYFRISTAASNDVLNETMNRMATVVAALKRKT